MNKRLVWTILGADIVWDVIHPPLEDSIEAFEVHVNLVERLTGMDYNEVVFIIETTPLAEA